MAFGPSPHAHSSGFGSSPTSAASSTHLDAPYAGPSADGFGGRDSAPDGFGPRPLAAGPQPDPERPVTHAELAEHGERTSTLRRLEHALATRFASMRFALEQLGDKLGGPREKASGFFVDLVNMAAAAAVAGAAGVVAEQLAKRVSDHVMPGFDWFAKGYQRFANDAIKEHLKKSFHLGMATRFESRDAALVEAFETAQFLRINAAEVHFHRTFDDHMQDVSTAELQAALAKLPANDEDAEVIVATQRQIALEWANLVARVHHGAGAWDPWAGPHGSAHAVPTREAAPTATLAAPANPMVAAEHASSNVDPDSPSIRDATDDDQRRLNPALHGVLEIDLWASGLIDDDAAPGPHRHTHFELYRRAGFGMRLTGVSDRVKGLLGSFSQVRELRMNKIVTLYDDARLDPPKPVGRFLITADGYIRRTSTEGGEEEMQDAAALAQSLSPGELR